MAPLGAVGGLKLFQPLNDKLPPLLPCRTSEIGHGVPVVEIQSTLPFEDLTPTAA